MYLTKLKLQGPSHVLTRLWDGACQCAHRLIYFVKCAEVGILIVRHFYRSLSAPTSTVSHSSSYPFDLGVVLDILEIWLRGIWVGDTFSLGLVGCDFMSHSHSRVLLNHGEQSWHRNAFQEYYFLLCQVTSIVHQGSEPAAFTHMHMPRAACVRSSLWVVANECLNSNSSLTKKT